MLHSFRKRSNLTICITSLGIMLSFLIAILLLFSFFMYKSYIAQTTHITSVLMQSANNQLQYIESAAEEFQLPEESDNIVTYWSQLRTAFRSVMSANLNISNILFYDRYYLHFMTSLETESQEELITIAEGYSVGHNNSSQWRSLSSKSFHREIVYVRPILEEGILRGCLFLCVSPSSFIKEAQTSQNELTQNIYCQLRLPDSSTVPLFIPQSLQEFSFPESFVHSDQLETQYRANSFCISMPMESDGLCLQSVISLVPTYRTLLSLIPTLIIILVGSIFFTVAVFSLYSRTTEKHLYHFISEIQAYVRDQSHIIQSTIAWPLNAIKVRSVMFLILLISYLIFISIASFASYSFAENTVSDSWTSNYKDVLISEVRNSFSEFFLRANNLYIQLLENEEFISVCRYIDSDPDAAAPILNHIFSDQLSSYNHISSVEYITPSATHYKYGVDLGEFSVGDDQFLSSMESTCFSFSKKPIRHQEKTYIAVGRELLGQYNSHSLGYLILYFDSTYFNALFSNSTSWENTFYITIDNIIIAHTDPDYIGYRPYIPSSSRYSSHEYTITQHEIDNPSLETSLIFTSILSNSEVRKDISLVLRGILILYFSAVILAFLVAYRISHALTKQLTLIRDKMEHFDPDSYVPILQQPINELASLAASFNQMAAHIQQLIADIKEEQEKQRIAELHALQAQINPHFLYNALGAISWKAKEQREYEIDDMIVILSTFLRIGLHNGLNFISVQQEIEHVKCYLEIERIRFPGLFDVQWELDENTFQYKTLKILLQPIVENSIKHGFRGKTSGCLITVKNYISGSDIVFEIIDNGNGAELWSGQLPPSSTPDGGYGLYNVNERLTHYYGGEYGIQMKSEPQKGTSVTIRIRKELFS